MVASPTVYLISGANRGIGFEITSQISSRPDVLVFAGARDPSKAEALHALAKKTGNIEIVKLASANEEDAAAVAKVIEEKAGKVDVVLANAGISDYWGKLDSQTPANFREMFEVNTLGPLVLFQGIYPVLAKSANPKFLSTSSELGSSTAASYPIAAYGTSKAALNHIIAHAHQDYPELTDVSFCPGWVSTDMGNRGAKAQGMEEAPVKVQDSAAAIIRLADKSTRETHGGISGAPSGTRRLRTRHGEVE
ncbi:hypothetical protein JCM8097_003185 [Rhodosporidiobolus ruineniae]